MRGQVLKETELSGGLANDVIDDLLDAHLVRAESRGGAAWFELAHDRLVKPVRASNATWFDEQTTIPGLMTSTTCFPTLSSIACRSA